MHVDVYYTSPPLLATMHLPALWQLCLNCTSHSHQPMHTTIVQIVSTGRTVYAGHVQEIHRVLPRA